MSRLLAQFLLLHLFQTLASATTVSLSGQVFSSSRGGFHVSAKCAGCAHFVEPVSTDEEGKFEVPIELRDGESGRTKWQLAVRSKGRLGGKIRIKHWSMRTPPSAGYFYTFHMGEFGAKSSLFLRLKMDPNSVGTLEREAEEWNAYQLVLSDALGTMTFGRAGVMADDEEALKIWTGQGLRLRLNKWGREYVRAVRHPQMRLTLLKVRTTEECMCLSGFKAGRAAQKLTGCRHFMHEECAFGWLNTSGGDRNGKCPICNEPMENGPTPDYHREEIGAFSAPLTPPLHQSQAAPVPPHSTPSDATPTSARALPAASVHRTMPNYDGLSSHHSAPHHDRQHRRQSLSFKGAVSSLGRMVSQRVVRVKRNVPSADKSIKFAHFEPLRTEQVFSVLLSAPVLQNGEGGTPVFVHKLKADDLSADKIAKQSMKAYRTAADSRGRRDTDEGERDDWEELQEEEQHKACRTSVGSSNSAPVHENWRNMNEVERASWLSFHSAAPSGGADANALVCLFQRGRGADERERFHRLLKEYTQKEWKSTEPEEQPENLASAVEEEEQDPEVQAAIAASLADQRHPPQHHHHNHDRGHEQREQPSQEYRYEPPHYHYYRSAEEAHLAQQPAVGSNAHEDYQNEYHSYYPAEMGAWDILSDFHNSLMRQQQPLEQHHAPQQDPTDGGQSESALENFFNQLLHY